ncbi:hypothetical protein MNV49_005830 [Pseudohyphozyma bogoriensis]|nr:hypothetical protein MNV49_005830 [Pseudohyphozyma bogoriensis]
MSVASPLHRPSPSHAQNLPYTAVLEIMRAARDNDYDEYSAGGRFVRWDTHESVAPYVPLCKAWEPAATLVLYQSLSIFGADRADKFLATVAEKPELADMVRKLVVGLGDDVEGMDDGNGQAADSIKLIQVIAACPNLTHLQIRPLHASARSVLLPVVRSKSLVALVCAPRLTRSESSWDQMLYSAHFDLLLPTLTSLELDIPLFPQTTFSPRIRHLAPLPLTRLAVHAELRPECVWDLLDAAGSTLEHVYLYFEHLLPIKETADALAKTATSVQTLEFLSNPTIDQLEGFDPDVEPTLDRILPLFKNLRFLAVSTTDISNNLFRLLPPSLKTLRLHGFSTRGMVGIGTEMHNALADLAVDIHLEELSVFDTAEAWGGQEGIAVLERACAARGVRLSYLEDSGEEESEESSD